MRPVTGAALAMLVLAGCSEPGQGTGGGGRLEVAAAVYPLAEVARAVGLDRTVVSELTAPGVEPHDQELTTEQVDLLEDAAVVVFIGGGFQPAVEKAVQRSRGQLVDMLSEADVLRGAKEGDEQGADPHVWLDPLEMKRMATAVRDALSAADPPGADAYRDAAVEYVATLGSLDADYRNGLAECERRTIVTTHAAFGYLARRYRLVQVAVAGLAPEAEPDPTRLAEVVDTVRSGGHTTVFSETLSSPEVAETLAREAGAMTAVLNPIEGLTPEQGRSGADYLSLMRANLAELRKALGCQ